MKNIVFSVGLAVGLALAAMSGAQAATVSFDVSHAQLSNGFAPTNEQNLGISAQATAADQVGLQVRHVADFGQSTNAADVRLTHRYNSQFDSYAHVGASSRGTVLPQYQYGLGGDMRATNQLTLGVGLDHYKLRDDNKADVLSARASYTLAKLPLTVRGEADLQRTNNAADGMRYGAGVTWGHAGNWTASLDAQTGRVDYSAVQVPMAAADYNVNLVKVSGRYWVRHNWGLTVAGAKVHNPYYSSNQMDVGMFAQF